MLFLGFVIDLFVVAPCGLGGLWIGVLVAFGGYFRVLCVLIVSLLLVAGLRFEAAWVGWCGFVWFGFVGLRCAGVSGRIGLCIRFGCCGFLRSCAC